MDYHTFAKTTVQNGKRKKQYYYWYRKDGKQVQKVCKGCRTRAEAEEFIRTLPKLLKESAYIKDLTKTMFVPGSEHVLRRSQLGKSVKMNTLVENRRFVEYVSDVFGSEDIRNIKTDKVINYLVKQNRSASWKNQFLSCFSEVYQEANWNGIAVKEPDFPRFRGKTRKADVFLPDEMKKFLTRDNFGNDTEYMLFTLTLSAGMRISEARGFRVCQFLPESQMIIIDGFMDRANVIRNNYNKTGSDENRLWRVAIIPDVIAYELNKYIAESAKDYNDLLFTYQGAAYRIEYLRTLFNRALKKSGIDATGRKLTMHSLRYTWVTNMRRFLDIDPVRKMAGHSSAEMTEYYTRAGIADSVRALKPYVADVNRFFDRT